MASSLWFTISPLNDVTRAILDDPRNRHQVIRDKNGLPKIMVKIDDCYDPNCILSFGRDRDCSVICDPPTIPSATARQISRRQCHFFLANGSLMLRDDSSGASTRLAPRKLDPSPWKFTHFPRQRALVEENEWKLAFGPVEFHLGFNNLAEYTTSFLECQLTALDGWWDKNSTEKKILAERKVAADRRGTDPGLSLPLTSYHTRVQSPRVPDSKLRDDVLYHRLEYLGKGSFGEVTRVLDLKKGGILAMKVIVVARDNEKGVKEELKKEVELLAKLTHPHVVRYKHSQGWELGGNIEIFMEAADYSLRSIMGRVFSRTDLGVVARQIAKAINYLHEMKIIHRDIKPENILCKGLKSGTPRFLLADFGLSKQVNTSRTFAGTSPYIAPEIWRGAEQGTGVDIWSFGVVIYEMLTGSKLDKAADDGYSSGKWHKHLEEQCRNGGDLEKMLTIDPSKRIPISQCLAESFPSIPSLSYDQTALDNLGAQGQ